MKKKPKALIRRNGDKCKKLIIEARKVRKENDKCVKSRQYVGCEEKGTNKSKMAEMSME